ncbi:MAG: hypothetical protein U5R46_09745 [Gammaproteobacteria bacterium]|nr:hypothetical protein [Gammaproteobacteria bacterium]
MTFLITYLLALFLPGRALTSVMRLSACRTTASIALSLSVLVLSLLLARTAGLGVQGFGYLLAGTWALVAAAAAMAWWLKPPIPEQDDRESVWDGTWIVPVLTLGAVAGYMLWAGPYIEVPSDAWWHIARINDRLDMVADGSIGSVRAVTDMFEKQAAYWHTIAAYFLHITGTGLEPGLQHLAMANTLLFCAGIYSFALFVFRDVVVRRWTKHWVAAATVFFFFAHFGISVFSYVRYYIFAPTVLNYIVYFAAVAYTLNYIRRGECVWWTPVVTLFLGVIAALVHMQEAVFIATMSGAMVLVEFLRVYAFRTGMVVAQGPVLPEWATHRRVVTLLAVFVITYGLLHIWAFLEVTRHNPLNHGVMADIRHYLPFLQNLYILKPNHQFYQVITVWGVLVYILFLAGVKRFAQSPFLIAGMAMPLLTVFNPVFTDFFLRFSWPEVLWRMCYMLPLPFVGAYFLVKSLAGVFRAPGGPGKGASLVAAMALLALLFPFQGTYFISPYSKIYTLAPVAAGNDHRIWRDLLRFLDNEPAARIVTDPVTGYVINGLTAHRYPGYKFYGSRTMGVDREAYSAADFRHAHGGLVVINRRDGAASETGRHGRHWPADVMQVSGHYSPAFVRFVVERPGMFKPLWEQDQVAVYRITESGEARSGREPRIPVAASSAIVPGRWGEFMFYSLERS